MLHKHLLSAVVGALKEIFSTEQYADKVIERELRFHKKWGARDRKFFAETTYDMVRWWRRLWFLVGQEPDLDSQKIWLLFAVYGAEKKWISVSRDLLPQIDNKVLAERVKKLERLPAIAESIPDWLFKLGQEELGERWLATLSALNQTASAYLRVNTLRATLEEAQAALQLEGIESTVVENHPWALRLVERKNIFKTKAFFGGKFEMQDIASQTVAPFLDPKPGERVIDACAGAGGKTLHLAMLMKNRGKILALDISEKKLIELQRRAARSGVDLVEVKHIDSLKVIKRLEESADKLLLDVPCSGLGVLRRNPDTKWKLKLEDIEKIQNTQREIISQYSRMTKKGGVMVYATCSILPRENEAQVRWFLEQPEGKGWKLLQEERFWPQDGYDGFYAAKLSRES